MQPDQLETHRQNSWTFYKDVLGSPKYVLAPMVDQSELAFRLLARKYGAQLCYSPMLHSRVILENAKYYGEYMGNRQSDELKTLDSPFIVQFCGNDPQFLVQAARKVEHECQAVDLNLGCPQGIARKGNYGSFLLDYPDKVYACVWAMYQQLKVPVTCKVRIQKDINKTLEICKQLERHGCSLLTVHGRTKEQNKLTVGECDWQVIKQIKETIGIPVVANGGIYWYDDVQRCLEQTGCDGVMSSEGALENVAIFQPGDKIDLDQIAAEYLVLAEKHNEPTSWAKSHLFKFLHQGLKENVDLRTKLGLSKTYQEFWSIQKELQQRRNHMTKEQKFGWYWRHHSFKGPNGRKKEEEQKQREKEEEQKQREKEEEQKQREKEEEEDRPEKKLKE